MFNPRTSFKQLLKYHVSEAEDAQTPYLLQCFNFRRFPTEWPRASLWLLVCFWPVIKDNSGLCELILHECGCCVGRANFELFPSAVVIRHETEVVFREIQAPKVVWKNKKLQLTHYASAVGFLVYTKKNVLFFSAKTFYNFPQTAVSVSLKQLKAKCSAPGTGN